MYMFPKLLTKRIENFFPQDREIIFTWFTQERVASFRINILKIDEWSCRERLIQAGFSIEKFPPIPFAYTLSREDEYRLKWSEFFREGLIYMQSLSSMLPALVLQPKKNETILDVCAAPGSKTLQMSVLMGNAGRIIALEKSPIRHDVLLHNIALQWVKNIETIRMEGVKYLSETTEMFDAILLDAPCSAEGRIRMNDERTYGFFSLENIKKKSRLQKELLQCSLSRLKKWGRLVYSTCTLAPEENEGVISDILLKNPDCFIEEIKFSFQEFRQGITPYDEKKILEDLKKTARILPSKYFEGFYIAKLTKK